MIHQRWPIIILLVLAILAISGALLIYLPAGGQREKEFTVSEGDGSAKVARLLAQEKLIRSRYLFLFYLVLTGRDRELKAGRYLLSSRLNIPAVAEVLADGRALPDDLEIVVPEGFNVWEIDRRLAVEGPIKAGVFFKRAQGEEGRLFPDTYRLKRPAASDQQSAEKLIKELLGKMRVNFERKTNSKITPEQLIIASLLEKEVRETADLEIVAGIIYQRLELKMPLQVDASVAYGACLAGGGEEVPPYQPRNIFCDVSQINLAKWIKIDSPYNTYLRLGLPAGPISNPGERAIQASLFPQASDYLYYLSARDGRTIFSRTAGEHERNRRKHLGI